MEFKTDFEQLYIFTIPLLASQNLVQVDPLPIRNAASYTFKTYPNGTYYFYPNGGKYEFQTRLMYEFEETVSYLTLSEYKKHTKFFVNTTRYLMGLLSFNPKTKGIAAAYNCLSPFKKMTSHTYLMFNSEAQHFNFSTKYPITFFFTTEIGLDDLYQLHFMKPRPTKDGHVIVSIYSYDVRFKDRIGMVVIAPYVIPSHQIETPIRIDKFGKDKPVIGFGTRDLFAPLTHIQMNIDFPLSILKREIISLTTCNWLFYYDNNFIPPLSYWDGVRDEYIWYPTKKHEIEYSGVYLFYNEVVQHLNEREATPFFLGLKKTTISSFDKFEVVYTKSPTSSVHFKEKVYCSPTYQPLPISGWVTPYTKIFHVISKKKNDLSDICSNISFESRLTFIIVDSKTDEENDVNRFMSYLHLKGLKLIYSPPKENESTGVWVLTNSIYINAHVVYTKPDQWICQLYITSH